MFGSLGMPEMIFLVVLALLVFGPKRLPELGRTVGRGMSEFRKATTDLRRSIEVEVDEPPPPRSAPRALEPPAPKPKPIEDDDSA